MDPSRTPQVAVVSGGVGAARFLRGLQDVVPGDAIAAVVNTGDDTVLHGLTISPDLDTITYTLAGAIDPERGWGLGGETWQAMAALGRYAGVRPDGSGAAATWFNLGDRDLATHLYRTARLAEGATPTAVADEVRRAWGLDVRLLPMTDGRQATMIELATGGEVSFQDYFVRLHHDVAVRAVRFASDGATPTAEVLAALESAAVVVVAPSNPLVSIGPVRALPGIDELLARRRDGVVAVSPIVGGAALKGPADRMLVELGHEASVVGVAELYAPIASALVIDPIDGDLAPAVERAGMRAIVQPSVMSTPAVAADLARATLRAAG
jgi:LPPG:FO 2-phospho-L-lactate transferase